MHGRFPEMSDLKRLEILGEQGDPGRRRLLTPENRFDRTPKIACMSDSSPKAFYVTTPIYYVTAAPSIGNAYTTVAADVLARWHRQRGEPIWFLTGTDEHGQKVLARRRGARRHAAGVDRPAGRDRVGAGARRSIDASNDDFIRTTEPRHTERVQEFWQTIYDARRRLRGHLRRARTASRCEEFKLPAELLDGEDGVELCPIHERPVETAVARSTTSSR